MNARQIQKQVREAHVRGLGFDSALKLHDDMYARWSAASDALNAFVNQFPKGPMNLTPNYVRAMPEYKALKAACADVKAPYKAFAEVFNRVFKREYAAYVRARLLEGNSVAAVPPARFGSRALWVGSASALAVGIAGASAYGVWFNHDHRGYVEAMASARPALGITGPTLSTQQASSSAQVPIPSLPPARGTAVASAERVPPGSSARFDHRATPPVDSDPRQLATARPGRVNHLAMQNRRHLASHVTASARQVPGTTGPTSTTQQTSSSPRVALSSSPPAPGTAVTSADIVPPASSALFNHRAAPSPDSAAPQLARVRPGEASYSHP